MVPLDAGIASLGNWKQLGFVAPDAKGMMDRLSAVGFGPFKVYRVDSGDWEGVNCACRFPCCSRTDSLSSCRRCEGSPGEASRAATETRAKTKYPSRGGQRRACPYAGGTMELRSMFP